MRSAPYKTLSLSFFFLWLTLFFWTHLSSPTADRLRLLSVASIAPVSGIATLFQGYLADRPFLGRADQKSHLEEVAELRLQNQLLQSELKLKKETLLQEKVYKKGITIPAKVIYRAPSSWGNSLWIDVGEEENQLLGFTAISRNSPVVEGNALIGVVDYVGKKQSRVRLITDSGLNPAVRVDRGAQSDKEIHFAIDALAERLEGKPDCLEKLSELKAKIPISNQDLYLAKGELRGSINAFWRNKPLLKGVGFNYNYSDPEGAAKDLRSAVPIIQKGDHLITSGLDGVFPFGLSVAVVKKVISLAEGSFSYEIEAVPSASSLSDLKQLFVLPSTSE